MTDKEQKPIGKIRAFRIGASDSVRQHLYEAGHQAVDGIVEALRDVPEGWTPPGADRWKKRVEGNVTPQTDEEQQYQPEIKVVRKRPGLLTRLSRIGTALLALPVGKKETDVKYPWLKDKND